MKSKKKLAVFCVAVVLMLVNLPVLNSQTTNNEGPLKFEYADRTFWNTEGSKVYYVSECLQIAGSSCTTPGSWTRKDLTVLVDLLKKFL